MSKVDTLLKEYAGDDAWERFATAWGAESGSVTEVADKVVGKSADHWFTGEIPALDGARPSEILSYHPQGETIIRAVLMRFP